MGSVSQGVRVTILVNTGEAMYRQFKLCMELSMQLEVDAFTCLFVGLYSYRAWVSRLRAEICSYWRRFDLCVHVWGMRIYTARCVWVPSTET